MRLHVSTSHCFACGAVFPGTVVKTQVMVGDKLLCNICKKWLDERGSLYLGVRGRSKKAEIGLMPDGELLDKHGRKIEQKELEEVC